MIGASPKNARDLGWLRREQAGFTSFVGLPSRTHGFRFQVSKSHQEVRARLQIHLKALQCQETSTSAAFAITSQLEAASS